MPLIWLPNSPDPTLGRDIDIEHRNYESAANLYAVHSLKKWIAFLPRAERNVRQIFLNAQMSDNAYWGKREASTHTVQFLEMHLLNNFKQLTQLDISRAFAKEGDYFSAYACHVMDLSLIHI